MKILKNIGVIAVVIFSLSAYASTSVGGAPALPQGDEGLRQEIQTLLRKKESIYSVLAPLDQKSTELLQSQTLSRQEKLDFLWRLAEENQDDPIKFSYVLDTLAELRPIELTSKMIALFDSQKEVKNQNRLLSTMTRTLSLTPEKKDAIQLLNQNIDNVVRIQLFFIKLLQESTDPMILREAISDYPSIVPAKQAKQSIDEALIRMQKDNIKIIPYR